VQWLRQLQRISFQGVVDWYRRLGFTEASAHVHARTLWHYAERVEHWFVDPMTKELVKPKDVEIKNVVTPIQESR
jgi:hypothetical protein